MPDKKTDRKTTDSPALTFDAATRLWDFAPFVVWLKEQGVFDVLGAAHPHGPTPQNLAMLHNIHQQPDSAWVRLPEFPGDHIGRPAADKLPEEDAHLAENTIKSKYLPAGADSDHFRHLLFASYAGMLEKIFSPCTMQPYLKQVMSAIKDDEASYESSLEPLLPQDTAPQDEAEFSLTLPRKTKTLSEKEYHAVKAALIGNPAINSTIQQYDSGISEYMMGLDRFIEKSGALTAEEKKRGNTICQSILENAGLYSDSQIEMNLLTAIGLAYVVNHQLQDPQRKGPYPAATRKDFQDGMEFLRKQEFFKLANVRCPAESQMLKLTGAMAGISPDGKPKTSFGNMLFEAYLRFQAQLEADVARKPSHVDRLSGRGDFGIR